jgi:hypothetical protein
MDDRNACAQLDWLGVREGGGLAWVEVLPDGPPVTAYGVSSSGESGLAGVKGHRTAGAWLSSSAAHAAELLGRPVVPYCVPPGRYYLSRGDVKATLGQAAELVERHLGEAARAVIDVRRYSKGDLDEMLDVRTREGELHASDRTKLRQILDAEEVALSALNSAGYMAAFRERCLAAAISGFCWRGSDEGCARSWPPHDYWLCFLRQPLAPSGPPVGEEALGALERAGGRRPGA